MDIQNETDISHQRCEDELTLQRFMDEELSPDAAEIVLYHVEKCAYCGERLHNLKIVKAFCRDQLGREDEAESEFTRNALLRIRSRLDIQETAGKQQNFLAVGRITGFFDRLFLTIADFGSALGWRAVTVPAAILLIFAGLVFWFVVSPSSSISASEILSESELRTQIWENQPGKVLHWITESTFTNHVTLPDGNYRSLRWQNNTGGKSRRLSRTYNENGVLVWALWTKEDGGKVIYSNYPEEEIKIYPGTEVLRSYAANLDDKSRQLLEKYYIGPSDRAAELGPESNSRVKQRSINRWLDLGSVQIIQTSEAGKVFRIRLNFKPGAGEKYNTGELESDIAADSFIRTRLKSVRYFPDGKTAIEEAWLKNHRETTVEDFNAHDLGPEMRRVKRIVHVAPEELLRSLEKLERPVGISERKAN